MRKSERRQARIDCGYYLRAADAGNDLAHEPAVRPARLSGIGHGGLSGAHVRYGVVAVAGHDERPIDKHGVCQMLRHLCADRVLVLDVAYLRRLIAALSAKDKSNGVIKDLKERGADLLARIQLEFLYLAHEREERRQLLHRRTGRDVCDLDHGAIARHGWFLCSGPVVRVKLCAIPQLTINETCTQKHERKSIADRHSGTVHQLLTAATIPMLFLANAHRDIRRPRQIFYCSIVSNITSINDVHAACGSEYTKSIVM